MKKGFAFLELLVTISLLTLIGSAVYVFVIAPPKTASPITERTIGEEKIPPRPPLTESTPLSPKIETPTPLTSSISKQEPPPDTKLSPLPAILPITPPPPPPVTAKPPSPPPLIPPPSPLELKSKFFKDERVAKEIIAGKITDYSIDNFSIGKEGNTNTFAFKFLSGLQQLGYVTRLFTDVPVSPQLDRIARFQKDYNLPSTSLITQEGLLKLDALLMAREKEEELKGNQFPLCLEFGTSPPNWPSKEHLCFLYAQVFKNLPEYLVPWSKDNFSQFFAVQYGNPTRQEIDKNYYWNWSQPTALSFLPADYAAMTAMIHEYGHYIESLLSPGKTQSFYDISWESDRSKAKYGLDSKAWLTRYGAPVNSLSEDFAESFAMYVMQGKVFRDKAKENPIVNSKYGWLKMNIFQGREYNTGNTNWKSIDFGSSLSTSNPLFQKDRGGNPQDYSLFDPSFSKWDFQIVSF